MKSLLLAPLALLAACGGTADPNAPQGNGAAAPAPGQPDNRIDCRPAGAAAFERACTVDSVETPRGRGLAALHFERVRLGHDRVLRKYPASLA